MINHKAKIEKLIEDKRLNLNSEKDRLLEIFKENFSSYQKLINEFKKHRGKLGYEEGAYLTISKLLAEDNIFQKGGETISVAQVAQNMKIIRKIKVGKRRAYKSSKITSTATANLQVATDKNKAVSVDSSDVYWTKILDEVNLNKWSILDRKHLLDLERLKESGIELSSIQNICFHKLLEKKETK